MKPPSKTSYFEEAANQLVEEIMAERSRQNKFWQLVKVLMLVLTIVLGASCTPLTTVLPVEAPILKLTWRQLNMLPFLFIGAGIEMAL